MSRSTALGVRARVELVEYLGAEMILNVKAGGQDLVIREDRRFDAKVGEDIYIYLDMHMVHFFDPSTGRRLEA